MKTFLAVICSLALVFAANGAQDQNNSKKKKKKQAQTTQHHGAPVSKKQQARGRQHPTTSSRQATVNRPPSSHTSKKSTSSNQARVNQKKGQSNATRQTNVNAANSQKVKGSNTRTVSNNVTRASNKTFKTQHYNLQTNTRPVHVNNVTFVQNRRIVGSSAWVGPRYTVFRNYNPVWHNRAWWGGHYNRIVFVFGGWYAWNAGWWYPAWGYAPSSYYAYDGPIYAYNGLTPDQVTANVQTALQEQGYYQGDVDGLLGPQTRDALANYQRDNGLYETAAIDQPTLEALGMS